MHSGTHGSPTLPPLVADRLSRLAPDQRAAATAKPGPVLCIAPAGSGKTTTLVARVAWLVAMGAPPGTLVAITFNARAAEELRERLEPALESLAVPPDAVRVRTFHALGLEILRDSGTTAEPRAARTRDPACDRPGPRRRGPAAPRRRLLAAEARPRRHGRRRGERPASPDRSPGPSSPTSAALASAGASDFDDLVAGALRALEGDSTLLARWRARCAHLLVDEVQDVDRSQLRLALLLAAPANRVFLVGDDDQSIYGWRLADVRRVLALADTLRGLRRVDLAVNYRCPAPVLARAVRLVEHNAERFAKRVRPGPDATGRLILAPARPEPGGLLATLLGRGRTTARARAILARTRRELLPVAAEALELGVPFRADGVTLAFEDPRVDGILARRGRGPTPPAARRPPRGSAPAERAPTTVGRAGTPAPHRGQAALEPGRPRSGAAVDRDELRAALVGWAVRLPPDADLGGAIPSARDRLTALRTDDAPLTLATAHATKGLEWDHVAVLGMTEGRFPSARSLREAADPARAVEEERRLAYVAWTRARRSLTLVFDPAAPSPVHARGVRPGRARISHGDHARPRRIPRARPSRVNAPTRRGAPAP